MVDKPYVEMQLEESTEKDEMSAEEERVYSEGSLVTVFMKGENDHGNEDRKKSYWHMARITAVAVAPSGLLYDVRLYDVEGTQLTGDDAVAPKDIKPVRDAWRRESFLGFAPKSIFSFS